MKGRALAVLGLFVLSMVLLVVPSGAIHKASHAPTLTYSLGSHGPEAVLVNFLIENLVDVVARTNIQTIWTFGDGFNATLKGENKLGSEVNRISHFYRYPGFYAVNVTIFVNRHSNDQFETDLNLILNLPTEAIKDLDRAEFVASLQATVLGGGWLFVPLFFGIGIVMRAMKADGPATLFRILWMVSSFFVISILAAPFIWMRIYDYLPK